MIKAEARFKDKRTVIAGDVEIRARRFVIATGSSPVVPPIEGLDTVDYFTNETIFEQTRRPGHLIVVGGGPVGIELAQAYRRLGSEVTVVEAATALAGDDPELAAIALDSVRADGVTIRERTRVERVERRGKTGISVYVEAPEAAAAIDGTHLLIAAGRAANVAGLDLDKAGIAYERRRHHGVAQAAHEPTAASMRSATSCRRAADSPMSPATMPASSSGRCCSALPARENRGIIPRVTFTDPELAHVGLTEAEAVALKHGDPHPALAATRRTTAPRPSAGPRGTSRWWST